MNKTWMVCLLAFAAGTGGFLGSRFRAMGPLAQVRLPGGVLKPQSRSLFTIPVPSDGEPRRVSVPRREKAKTGSSAAVITAATASNLPFHAKTYFSLPMAFESNVGQADPSVQLIGRGRGLSVYLTRRGIDLQVAAGPASRLAQLAARPGSAPGMLRLALEGNSLLDWMGEERLPGKTNYIIGNDPGAWHTNVAHFARAESRRKNHLGAAIYDNGKNLEYDLRLPRGLDARKIRLRIAGADEKHLAPNGDLLLAMGPNVVTIGRPAIFEEARVLARAKRREISGGFVLEADGSVGIRVGAHDPRAGLVVDPSISVSYATFFGGSGTDSAASVAVDSAGKVYISGTTTSASTFPESPSKSVGSVDGPIEFFIAKIDPTMTGPNSLVYLTFLGGSGVQSGGLLALDSSNDVAITGTTTAADFPVTGGGSPTSGLTSGLGNDAVISELDPTGSQLVFSALLGGTGAESANAAGGIAIGPGGSVYVASDTSLTSLDANSPDLPVTAGAMQPVWDGQKSDGFLAIFTPPTTAGAAATLKYCSYLGTNSSGAMSVGGIAVDSAGDAYITGATDNSINGFPALGALEPAIGAGGSDAFLMKISPTGQASSDLVYATLLGGSSADAANAVALDQAIPPNAYVAGTTQSTNFPVNGALAGYRSTLQPGAAANAFLSVIGQDSNGHATLAYSTYLGGSSNDSAQGLAVVSAPGSSASAVYVTGVTTSWDFPWRDNFQPFNGAQDAFVAKFNTAVGGASSLIYATALGGTLPSGLAATQASAIAAQASAAGNRVFVAGRTTASDFPTAITTAGTAVGGVQAFCSSCQVSPPATSNSADAFLIQIGESATAVPSVRFNVPAVVFSPASPGASITSQPLAVMNSGEIPLNISGLQIAGSQEFQLLNESNACQTSVAPGQTPGCSFEVAFAPATAGLKHASLLVTDDAPGSPQILELSGTGQGPVAVVSPPSIAFGSQPENASSSSQTITLSNAGDEPLTITNVIENGTGATQFRLQGGSCGANSVLSSAPGQSTCTINLVFWPNTTGSFQAEIDITDNSAGGSTTQSVPLTGTGTASAPIANISPISMALAFGSVATQAASAAQAVTLTNVGSASLNISGIAITGANGSEFSIVAPAGGGPCPTASGVLPPGTSSSSSCALGIVFAPQTAGAKSAILSINDNAAGSPQQVTLTGTATAASVLQVSPASLSFNSQSEGTSSAAQIITLANNGSTAASGSGISLSGASDFAIANPCSIVQAGKSCQISVTFNPAASASPGNRSASLNVPGGTPAAVPLSGVATQPSILLPTSLNFGSQVAGTSGTAQPFTVTNNSSGPFAGALAVTTVSVSSDFSISSDACASTSTAPAGTCTIQIAFTPQAGGSCATPNRTSNLSLTDNAPASPQSVPLSGTAMDFCFNAPGGQAISAPVPPGQVIPPYSVLMTSSAGFTGTVALSCTPPSGVGITCGVTPASVQVTPATPGQFQVTGTTTGVSTAALAPQQRFASGSLSRSAWYLAALFALCLLMGISGVGLRKSSLAMAAGKPRKLQASLARFAQAMALALSFAAGMAACGGGGTAASDPPPAATPPGTYMLMVTATTTVGSTQTTRTSQFTLTVN